jgi:hypothetical protein
MTLGVPCICISMTGVLNLEITSGISGSKDRLLISFTIAAPASSARVATFDLEVSIDSGTEILSARVSMTGIVRLSSSSMETGSEPGLVDSQPMSMISAPSSTIRMACSTARVLSKCMPPSEKESGVIFRMPIIQVFLLKSRLYRDQVILILVFAS